MVDGRRQNTWFAVFYGERPTRRVYNYGRNFEDGTNEAEALRLLKAEDLPSDAELAWTLVGDGCKFFQFKSKILEAAYPGEREQPQIAIFSGAEGPYSPSRAQEASVALMDPDDRDVGC